MRKRKRPSKPNATGRNDTSRFVRLDYRLLHSNAYRSLAPNARALLVELAMLYNGENNGSLYLGVQDAAHRMGLADHHAASRAFDDLQSLGFIEMTQEAHFEVKTSESSRARTWRLTCFPGPGRKMADWAFMQCEPAAQTPERRRMERGQRALKTYRKARDLNKLPVVESTTMEKNDGGGFHHDGSLQSPLAVVDFTTLIDRNGGFPPMPCVVESPPYIANQGHCSASNAAKPANTPAHLKLVGQGEPIIAPSGDAVVVAGDLQHRNCEQCSQPFELTRQDRSHERRFCSEICRKKAEKARYRRKVAVCAK